MKFVDHKTPLFGAGIWDVCYSNQVTANFLFKFSNIRYRGNRGWSETNCCNTFQFADLKTSCMVQKYGAYVLYKPNYSQFYVKMTVIGYHGYKGRSKRNLNDLIRLTDPENPHFGASRSVYRENI